MKNPCLCFSHSYQVLFILLLLLLVSNIRPQKIPKRLKIEPVTGNKVRKEPSKTSRDQIVPGFTLVKIERKGKKYLPTKVIVLDEKEAEVNTGQRPQNKPIKQTIPKKKPDWIPRFIKFNISFPDDDDNDQSSFGLIKKIKAHKVNNHRFKDKAKRKAPKFKGKSDFIAAIKDLQDGCLQIGFKLLKKFKKRKLEIKMFITSGKYLVCNYMLVPVAKKRKRTRRKIKKRPKEADTKDIKLKPEIRPKRTRKSIRRITTIIKRIKRNRNRNEMKRRNSMLRKVMLLGNGEGLSPGQQLLFWFPESSLKRVNSNEENDQCDDDCADRNVWKNDLSNLYFPWKRQPRIYSRKRHLKNAQRPINIFV